MRKVTLLLITLFLALAWSGPVADGDPHSIIQVPRSWEEMEFSDYRVHWLICKLQYSKIPDNTV